jgi:3-phosphoshikimate 1-carboxyvinyltransferase
MSESPRSYPDKLEVKPLERPPNATIRVPGSKSITNRALVLAALSRGETQLAGALQCEDTEVMVKSLRQLGFTVVTEWPRTVIRVAKNETSAVPGKTGELFVANSGTSMRFLTALVALGHGRYRLDGVPRMRERPIEDLLDGLRQLGVGAYSENRNGCPPVIVESQGLNGGTVRIRGDVSSQFVSALLMVAPLANGDVTIEIDGALVSEPYVRMTVDMMKQFGALIDSSHARFVIRKRAHPYGAVDYEIEPDASAASYFFGAAAIMRGKDAIVSLDNLLTRALQGDFRFVDVLEKMGCRIDRSDGAPWRVHGRPLHGTTVDMNAISDTVMTLAAVACFADGPTTIRNVAHIRHKETDRLAALATELRRLGAEVDEFADGLTITPRPLHGAEVETYNDHRMAMSLALIGLRVPGVVIKNPSCVAKTYPGFWEDLEKLRT